MAKVLVISESPEFLESCLRGLTERDCEVEIATPANYSDLEDLLKSFKPKAIVLDFGDLSEAAALEQYNFVRRFSQAQIITVASIGAVKDTMLGIELKVSCRLLKPFGQEALAFTVKEAAQRYHEGATFLPSCGSRP